jgi:hypothetical protein
VMRTRSLPGAYRTAEQWPATRSLRAPIDKGGGGTGFGAHELLEGALAVCISMAGRMYTAAHSIPLEHVSTQVQWRRPAIHRACTGRAHLRSKLWRQVAGKWQLSSAARLRTSYLLVVGAKQTIPH